MTTLFTTQVPTDPGSQDAQVTIGTVFTCSASDQTATGVRYYKGRSDGDGTTQTVYLFNASNTVIASGTHLQSGEPINTWITVPFTTPVALSSGVQYTVAHNTGAASKSYAATASGLASAGAVSNGPLATVAHGGRYIYTTGSAYPSNVVDTDFFIDIVTQAPNVAPTANAGVDQSVAAGAAVTLSGTDSDSDGTVASRAWAQTGGTAVTLSGATTATATFTAPRSASPSTLTFTYTVTDNQGATGTDTVVVSVAAQSTNVAPTCNAGADQTGIEPWDTVLLTATDADSDGTVVSRAWTQTAGTTVTMTGATTQSLSFPAPGTLAGDTLTFTYTVTDDQGATGTDSVSVTVLAATERAIVGGVEVPMQVREN